MTSISAAEAGGSEIIDPQTIDVNEAKERLDSVLDLATAMLQKKGHRFQVAFNGQPTVAHNSSFNPMAPIDLKLVYDDGREDEIDMVNIVTFPGYDPTIGRLTSGLKDACDLAAEIVTKVEEHLTAIEDPDILISKARSKYSTEKLTTCILSIDPQDYLRVNGYRIRAHGDDDWILSASSLRSHNILVFREETTRLYLEDEKDPAPHFYIMLNDFVTFATEEEIAKLPDKNRADALDYLASDKEGVYLKLSREVGKI